MLRRIDSSLEDKIIQLLSSTFLNLTEISEKAGISNKIVTNIQNKAIEEGKLNSKHKRLLGNMVQYQYDKILRLLANTDFSLTEISKEVFGSDSLHSLRKFQKKAIENGELDPKHRRMRGKGLPKHKYNEALELLTNTILSLNEIGKRIKMSPTAVTYTQNKAIKEGKLDPKYKRLLGNIVGYQYDKALELLKNTNFSLTKIGKESELSIEAVRSLQNRVIREGKLDPKYRRLYQGLIQHQHEKILELLNNPTLSLSEISKKTGRSCGLVHSIQNKALQEGKLDLKYRRNHESNFSKLLYAYVKS